MDNGFPSQHRQPSQRSFQRLKTLQGPSFKRLRSHPGLRSAPLPASSHSVFLQASYDSPSHEL
jgi:hypothetical protein